MKYIEILKRSVELAERVATRELHVESHKSMASADAKNLAGAAKRHLKMAERALVQDPLASKFLPQARIVVRARKKREAILDSSFLGKLMLAVASGCIDNPECPDTPIRDPFASLQDNEDWKNFLKGIAEANTQKTMDALGLLLASASSDLLYNTDLPPLVGYQFPRFRSTKLVQ